MAVADQPAFIGREAELRRLADAIARARTGPTRTLFVGGDAGIGKSTLLRAALGRSQDATVLIGECPPVSEGMAPLASIAAVLRALVAHLPPGEVDEVLGSARSDLAHLLPGIGMPSPMDEATGRTRALEALRAVIERFAQGRGPVVLLLEDLHWADASTRDVVTFLVHGLRDAPLLILGTYRSDGLPVGHPWRTTLIELDRSDRVERLEVERFGRDEIGLLVEARLADPRPELVEAILQRSDGNPLFAEELLASGAATTGELPESLRETMLGRISAASPEVQALLRLAAVFGREFDDRGISALLGENARAVPAALREALHQQFLVLVRDEHGERFAFRHALLREVVYAELTPGERRSIHGAVAQVLEAAAQPSGPRVDQLAELAGHWLAADDAPRAVPALLRAAAAAETIHAFAEASAQYDAALRLWDRAAAAPVSIPERRPIGFAMRDEAGDPRPARPSMTRPEVVRRAAEMASLVGRSDRAVALARELTTTEEPGVDRAAMTLDLERLARYLGTAGDVAGALATVERAIALGEGLAPTAERARVLASRARLLVNAGRFGEARDAAGSAITAAEAVGAAVELATARSALGLAMTGLGDAAAGLDVIVGARRELAASARPSVIQPRPSRIGAVIHGYADLASALDRAGRSEDAATVTREGAEIARRLGVGSTWGSVLETHEAVGLVHLGRWDEAELLTRRLLSRGAHGAPAARLLLVRAALETGRGWFADAEAHADAASIALAGQPDPQLSTLLATTRAELDVWQGRLSDARAAVDAGLQRVHGGEDALGALELCWLGIRAEADRVERARSRRASSELEEAREAAALLRAEVAGLSDRFGRRATAAPRELRGFAPLATAEATRLDGTPDPEAWAQAAAAWAQLRDPWRLAYARWREAEALLTAGRSERARAEASLREAFAATTALAAAPLLTEIEDLARRARVELTLKEPDASTTAATAPEVDRLGLTMRELEVLALMAAGRTNRQIGEELFITEKTAGHHVSNVLAKLDAATRVEAAAIAHRLGLLEGVEPGVEH